MGAAKFTVTVDCNVPLIMLMAGGFFVVSIYPIIGVAIITVADV